MTGLYKTIQSESMRANIINEAIAGVVAAPFNALRSHFKSQGQTEGQDEDQDRMAVFWRETLAGCGDGIALFPTLPAINEPAAEKRLQRQVTISPSRLPRDITTTTLIHASWALVAGSMTSSTDVLFGATSSGKNPNIPAVVTLPVRVRWSTKEAVCEYLQRVQRQSTESMSLGQTGLEQIRRVSHDAELACRFQTLVVMVQSHVDMVTQLDDCTSRFNDTLPLVLEVAPGEVSGGELIIKASFDSRVLDPTLVETLLARLAHITQQLSSSADAAEHSLIADVEVMLPRELAQIWEWNKAAPDRVDRLVHGLVQDRAEKQPDALAIESKDGILTYRELDQMSSTLARFLGGETGLESGTIVPLCFEKSPWTAVAMMAVLKAGGAFVLLDPSWPEQRLRAVVAQVNSGLILSSTQCFPLSSRLAGTVIDVTAETIRGLEKRWPATGPAVSRGQSSETLMYVGFMSGSNGTPKGVVISHANMASALAYQADTLGLNTSSRVFDSAPYASDIAIANAFGALVHGGCLCVPDEETTDTNDVASILRDMAATFTYLTPSAARSIDPRAVPRLETLVLTGEPVLDADMQRWRGKVPNIISAYGPAECTPISVMDAESGVPTASSVTRIGKGGSAGVVTWVVDVDDHGILVPPGSTGELLLEGPLVGLGYLDDDAASTAHAFIEAPSWLKRGHKASGHSGRAGTLYKTGDLVRYASDGSLIFVGRRDTQVQIHGQRVELEEVEQSVKSCMPELSQIVVERIVPDRGSASPILAVFFSQATSEATETAEAARVITDDSVSLLEVHVLDDQIEDKLSEHLPAYMIPSVCCTLREMPVTASGKVDRKRLREIGGSLNTSNLAGMHPTWGFQQQPTTKDNRLITQDDGEGEYERRLNHLVEKLESSRPAEIPTDRIRPRVLSGDTGEVELIIGDDLRAQLHGFCETSNGHYTMSSVLLAVFRATHYRLTGTEDAVIGVLNPGRSQRDANNLPGPLENLQYIRTATTAESDFVNLVEQVQRKMMASSASSQQVQLEHVVSRLKRNPAQVAFAYHALTDQGRSSSLHNVDSRSPPRPPTTRFDIEFHFHEEAEGNGRLGGRLVYSKDLYCHDVMANVVSVFQCVLEGCLREPHTRIMSLDLLNDEARYTLDRLGLLETPRRDYSRDASVADVFRKQAYTKPHKLAVKDSSRQLTYGDLDSESDALARWLSRHSLPAESLVGVFATRSCETIVAFLAILKANLAYLPFDTRTPPGRMEMMLDSLPRKAGEEEEILILVGSGVDPPRLAINRVRFVHISDAMEEEERGQAVHSSTIPSPSATSLAYVMFTSGSTGRPKGVMIEHRGIMRLAKNCNMNDTLAQTSSNIAFLSNTAFDAATWEIYTAILNGNTLICIDNQVALDPLAFERTVLDNHINVVFTTPMLLKQYLSECPAALQVLKLLIVAGDRLDPADIKTAQRQVSVAGGKVANGYGPTENTGISTHYLTRDSDVYASLGVPIGRSISNSGTHVMDAEQRLVPVGVVGELVVTGDGLARGYTDPARDAGRFVTITLQDSRTERAYRTGDYVRYRTDGELEYMGRIDGQVKIRGQRLELGEIEHLLRTGHNVKEAAVVLHKGPEGSGQDDRLAAFVTIKDVDATRQDGQEEQEVGDDDYTGETGRVERWSTMFDEEKYNAIEGMGSQSIGRDFLGWTSMYDGSDIDKVEMAEWLDDTISTLIRPTTHLGNILEVGTGSGMMLFNLARHLSSYVGFEPSARAVAFLNRTSEALPSLRGRVSMFKGAASDLHKIDPERSVHVAVVNSVAQYFPSQEYLSTLIKNLLQLRGIKRLYFGDMRSLALYQQFCVGRALCMVGDGDASSAQDIRRMTADMEKVEMELLVDPGFFTSLLDRLPDLVDHVEIIPKTMRATNELSAYRYAAVIHAKGLEQPIIDTQDFHWVDFMAEGLTSESLGRMLKNYRQMDTGPIAVSNIPHSKSILERCLVQTLDAASTPPENWVAACREKAPSIPSLSVIDLKEMAEQAEYQVELSWARQFSQQGGLDAIFYRREDNSSVKGKQVAYPLFRFPTDHAGRRQSTLVNQPLQQQEQHKRQQAEEQVLPPLRDLLAQQLPSYMIPQTISVLDVMPVNENGKIDRKDLKSRVVEVRREMTTPS